jgi:hypothetical protein
MKKQLTSDEFRSLARWLDLALTAEEIDNLYEHYPFLAECAATVERAVQDNHILSHP